MTRGFSKREFQAVALTPAACLLALAMTLQAAGYSFNETVPDVRLPASISGGSACPVPSRQPTAANSISLRWNTSLSANPVTILTQDQTANGRLSEIEQVIQQSLGVWTGVSGTTLKPASIAPLVRVTSAASCGADGLNSICFEQPDMAFTPGVLAFTRVVTADHTGEQLANGVASVSPGQILDADIFFNPSDSNVVFATPAVLAANPKSYDLESILTHELGHFFGFSHSAIWGAMMFPYAPGPGTFSGMRPTAQALDAPLSDDDRTGLRVLYPDPTDTVHIGSIQGQILPANPLSLPASPPGVSGLFGTHVVAIDAASGNVVAGTLGGWSCAAPGPVQFDGGYLIQALAVGRSYRIYAEPLNGAVDPSQVSNALTTICRNGTTDAGWPPLSSCFVPSPSLKFTTRIRPSP
ncbi:MAG: matrixin family metalloprotease [Acidobacteria bacterium]|nr:matrixin family metalloprotease [Acidobacteriota bacterium]MBS1865350.1 matrixin family metalloprotease [Acidobacteriota bacterium]